MDERKHPSRIVKDEHVIVSNLRRIVANMDLLKEVIFDGARQEANSHIKLIRRYYDVVVAGKVKDDVATVRIEYRQNDGIGRYYCGGNLGLQTLTRRVRHTISGGLYYDVDVVNAHPAILLWYCSSQGIPCECLREYVEHRERILKDVQANNLCVWNHDAKKNFPVTTRSGAKQMILSKINGSPQKEAWKNATYKKFKWYLDFCEEISNIWKEVAMLNPDMVEYADKQPKKKWDADLQARATNRVLLNFENDILMVINEYFTSCGIECEVLIHAGAQIIKKGINKQALERHLRACEKVIYEKLGMTGIHLLEKPMNQVLDLDECDDVKWIDDRDRFMHISRIVIKDRSDEEKAFYTQHRSKIAKENIDQLTMLGDDWVVRGDTDLGRVRKQLEFDLFNAQKRCVCIRAGMGVGKTHTLIDFMRGNKFPFVTVCTSRIAFAENIKKRYEKETGLKWVVYNDYNRKGRFTAQNLVVQAESLHFLEDRKDGLLIIDECESLFTQMTSFETHKHHKQNVEKLEDLLKYSAKIICLDAFFSKKTTMVLDYFNIPCDKFNYTIKLKPRYAQRIPLGVGCRCGKRNSCICPLVGHLIDEVKKGKKVYFICSSVKRWREKVKPTLEKHLPNKTILEYNGKHKSTSYAEIEMAWLKADVVCATSSITVGVDFSVAHFDLVFMYCSAASRNLMRDLFQAHYRVRQVADKKLVYSIDVNTRGLGPEYPLSRYRIRAKLHSTEGAITRLYAQQSTPTPEWLTKLAVENMLEHSLSVMNLGATFRWYLEECNYTSIPPPLDGTWWEIEEPPPEETFMELDNIKNLFQEDMEKLTSRKNKGENLTLEEQWGRQKYWFKKKIELRRQCLNEYFYDDISNLILEFAGNDIDRKLWMFFTQNSKKFQNLKYELHNLDSDDLGWAIKPEKYAQGNIGILQHQYIREIKSRLKLVHSQDFGAEVSRADVEEMVEWMNESFKNPITGKYESVHKTLVHVFEVRIRSKNPEINVMSGVGLINQILNKWGISKLQKSVKIIRGRVNGKRVDSTPFFLVNRKDFDIWGSLVRPYCPPPPPPLLPRKGGVRRRHYKRNVV